MKWFKHDSDASTDAKIKKLIIRHGAIGYAVYFHCLELISSDVKESNLTFELEHDSEIIADNLKINGDGMNAGVDIVNSIMRTIITLGLFQSSGEKIFCIKLAKRLDSSMTSNPAFRDLIKKSHDLVMIPSCLGHDTVMQEETRLEETRREKNIKKINKKENSQPFETWTGKKESPTKTHKDTERERIQEIKQHWKSCTNLPQSKALDTNMNYSHDILNTMIVFPSEDIIQAINNLSVSYPKIEAKYRIKSFSNFMTVENIEKWYPMEVVESYNDEQETEITEEQKKQMREIWD